jgi:hypothetical protein
MALPHPAVITPEALGLAQTQDGASLHFPQPSHTHLSARPLHLDPSRMHPPVAHVSPSRHCYTRARHALTVSQQPSPAFSYGTIGW